ncbi:MAG: methyltransferase [Flavobacteriia bacterium]|nr:methyltransferase [Flavobacteriia bacterium]
MDKTFWDKRYEEKLTGWDIGKISTPIKEYIDQLESKDIKILIPGCGFGHEAQYLFQKGFTNVYLMDISPYPLEKFKKNNPTFPSKNILLGDFFEHNTFYDLILEQTLFCAISPEKRDEYIKKIHELLNPKGKYVGVLFNCQFEGGPPFGGTKEDYFTLFSKYFQNISIKDCYNSIDARKEREVFIKAIKK